MNHRDTESGQALVTLLVFTSLLITLLTAAVMVTVINAQGTSTYTLGSTALRIAESGTENAIQRFLRNPSYAGETLSLEGGTATTTVTGTNPKTITTEGVINNAHRKIQVTATTTSGIISISAWSEIP